MYEEAKLLWPSSFAGDSLVLLRFGEEEKEKDFSSK